MIKHKQLKPLHQEWLESGHLDPQLQIYVYGELGKKYSMSELGAHLWRVKPAKNGFFAVWDPASPPNDSESKISPEDHLKIRSQRSVLQSEYPNHHIVYHRYEKNMRTFAVTGTFHDNERQPAVGQSVWMSPTVGGTVVRVCCGTPDLLSHVDIRLNGNREILTVQSNQLFDHIPAVATYKIGEETFTIWE